MTADGADASEGPGGLGSALPPALRHPLYRRYWIGAIASVAGYNLVYFAQLWLAYQLSFSPLLLGLMGLANAGPAFLLTFLGGVYADRLSRRAIILGSQVILAALAAGMAALDATGAVRIWHVFVIAAAAGSISAFDIPARQAFYPSLVDRGALTSAVALNASVWQAVRIAAPAGAGFLIALSSTSTVFVSGAVGFAVMAVLLMAVRPSPASVGEKGQGGAGRQLAEGIGYVRDRPEFRLLIGMVMLTSFFGGGYLILMPVFAVDVLRVGADGQGVLLAAAGVGSLAATLWLSSRTGLRGSGILLVGGAAMSGISLIAFAISAHYVGSYPLAIGLMLAVGVFTSVHMVTAMASLQAMVPDRLRGRIMALYGISWSVMLLGGLQAGLIAHFVGAPLAVAIGGAIASACALGIAALGRRVLWPGGDGVDPNLARAARRAGVDFARQAAPLSGRLRSGNAALHYLDWGRRADPSVLLLHGFAQSAHSFDLVSLSLSDSYRAVALDLRGHGDSDWSPDGDYSRGRHVADAEAVIGELGLAPVTVVGLSLGGTVGYLLAASSPHLVRSLVIVDIAPKVERAGALRVRGFVEARDSFASLDEMVSSVRAFRPGRTDEQLLASVLRNSRRLPDGRYSWKYDPAMRRPEARPRSGPAEEARLWSALTTVACPTLVVRGAESDIVSAESVDEMVRRMPDARAAEVPDAGHLVPGDNPAGFIRAIRPFLAETASA